ETLGADLLDVDRSELELAGGTVRIKGAPDRAVAIGEVVRRARRGNLLGRGTFQARGGLDPPTGHGVAAAHWNQVAGAAEVEVEVDTGKVRVLRYEGAVYAGRIINPVQARL